MCFTIVLTPTQKIFWVIHTENCICCLLKLERCHFCERKIRHGFASSNGIFTYKSVKVIGGCLMKWFQTKPFQYYNWWCKIKWHVPQALLMRNWTIIQKYAKMSHSVLDEIIFSKSKNEGLWQNFKSKILG